MGFPSEKELKMIRKKLAKGKTTWILPKNASKVDKAKYALCEKFVVYLMENEITQVKLAKMLKVDPARVSEIVHYRIDLYTVDKLVELAERLKLDFDIRVA